MPELKVNADGYEVLVPNQVQGQPPVTRLLRRGEVYDFSDEEAKRGQQTTVYNFYDGPAGPATIRREEPALVPATQSDKQADAVRRESEEIARLEQELAERRAALEVPVNTDALGNVVPDEDVSDESPRRSARRGGDR